METKHPTSIRLTPEARLLIALIAQKLGITKSAVLELAIRRMAQHEEVK